MTMRSTAQAAARVAQTGISRSTLREVDDNHLCQEVKFADVFHSETPSDFELWHPAGLTSVCMKQKEQQQQGQQGQQGGQQGGGGQGDAKWNKNQPKGEAAEAMMLYINGHRAHPVAMPNDRRARPYDMDPGECALYSMDGKGQIVYHRVRGDDKDGLYLVTMDDQQASERADGKQTQQTRFISIRHAQKNPQSRKPQKRKPGAQVTRLADGTELVQGTDGQQQQRYKHEGDSVNTEMRYTSQQMQFYDGSTRVGHYDRGKKDWLHHDGQGAPHSMRADKEHSHIKHEGNHIWVDKGNCWSSKPIQIQSDDCQ